MSHLVPTLLLVLCCVAGLLLIPLGLPGLWLMVLGVLGYGWLTAFRSVGIGVMALVVGLALLGEVMEWWLGFRFAERYGGSPRAGLGAPAGVMPPRCSASASAAAMAGRSASSFRSRSSRITRARRWS